MMLAKKQDAMRFKIGNCLCVIPISKGESEKEIVLFYRSSWPVMSVLCKIKWLGYSTWCQPSLIFVSFKILKYHVETVENCLRFVRISMGKFNPPDGFDFSKPQLWTDWKQRWTRYHKATELGRKDQEVQISSLIYAMDQKAESIYNQFKCCTSGTT